MERAQKRSAVLEQRFWFRKQVYNMDLTGPGHSHNNPPIPSPIRPGTPSNHASEKPLVNGFANGDAKINGNGPLPNGYGDPINDTSPSTGTQTPVFSADQSRCPSPHDSEEYEEMTINEVINGNVSSLYLAFAGAY